MGAENPLNRAHESAHWFHGRDGLGDHAYPPPKKAPEKQHAADAIIAMIEANPGLGLVTLGPLTNIALALQRKPELTSNGAPWAVMGGAPSGARNVPPVAEPTIRRVPRTSR